MLVLKNEFKTRLSHIKKLARYLSDLEKYNFNMINKKGISTFYEFDVDFKNILKWNLILLAYNLIEYVIVELIDKIYDQFDGYDFQNFNSELKCLFLSDLSKTLHGRTTSIKDFLSDYVKSINSSIVTCWYRSLKNNDRSRSLWWNISDKILKDLSTQYWFKLPKQNKHTKIDKFNLIKDNRNFLAHWEISFTDIGRKFSINELDNDIGSTIRYLEKIISEVEIYLANKDFLIK